MGEAAAKGKAGGKDGPHPWALKGSLIALAASLAFFVWAVTRGGDDKTEFVPAPTEARIVSEDELSDVAASVGHSVYWAGPIPGTDLEVTESADGSVLVRYLEDGAEVGEGTADFLAIGSYPVADAEKTMTELAEGPGTIVRHSPNGREVVTTKKRETNVYFSEPKENLQIEVFDPSPERAMTLARSKRVQPVD